MNPYSLYQEEVLRTCQELARQGYLAGTGGNVSRRIPGEAAMAITPSGREYHTLAPEEIGVVSFAGEQLAGGLRPSMETPTHTAVYAHRPDVNAIVHTHQPYASIFALLNEPIPALFDEQVLQLGPVVEVVPYGRSGSADLAHKLAARLGNGCHAYILQNHGVLCTGTTLAQTAVNVQVLEKCALVYYHALLSGKAITPLPASSIQHFWPASPSP